MSKPKVEFHRGPKKTLELTREILNETLEFPDDCDEITEKNQIKLFKNIQKDVQNFEEKVISSTKQHYDVLTSSINEYLKKEVISNTPISVFSPNECFGRLRTALVQCNFTDIDRITRDLKKKLSTFEINEEELRIEEIVITASDSVHTIIDRIVKGRADSYIMIVQQFESLQPETLESIISLLFSNEVVRKKLSDIRLIVCVSTSTMFFRTTCSTDTLNLLEIEEFKFTKLDTIFKDIVTVDIAPAVFSGKFLNYLRNRFFQCDYSVLSLIKAVEFAFLQKYLVDPLWRDEGDNHMKETDLYNTVLDLFCEEFSYKDKIDLHIQIQTDDDFWKNIEGNEQFRSKKTSYFGRESSEYITGLVERFIENIKDHDAKWCKELGKLGKEYEESLTNVLKEVETPKTPSKATPKKSFHDMRRQQNAEKTKKQNNPKMVAKIAIQSFIMKLFETVLKPYPSDWRNVVGDNIWEDSISKCSLDANDEYDIEKCLLDDRQNAELAISIAWKTLLCQKSFKIVRLADWAADFSRIYKKKDKKEAFFGAAGQLEHIGLIRGSADKKSTNVTILYHPMTFLPNT